MAVLLTALVHIRTQKSDGAPDSLSLFDESECGGYIRVRGVFKNFEVFEKAIHDFFKFRNAAVIEISDKKSMDLPDDSNFELGHLEVGTLHTYEKDDS